MQACREGGARIGIALRELHADYGGALLQEAWKCLRDEEAARDLLQDTLIKAWQRCATFRGDAELFPWLKRTLRNGAIDRLRGQQDEVSMHDDSGGVWPEVEEALRASQSEPWNEPVAQLEQRQTDRVFQRCAAQFAADHPQAAQLMRWIAEDGLGATEIGELLQRNPGATREYISQCRKKARQYFAEWYRLVACRGTADSAA